MRSVVSQQPKPWLCQPARVSCIECSFLEKLLDMLALAVAWASALVQAAIHLAAAVSPFPQALSSSALSPHAVSLRRRQLPMPCSRLSPSCTDLLWSSSAAVILAVPLVPRQQPQRQLQLLRQQPHRLLLSSNDHDASVEQVNVAIENSASMFRDRRACLQVLMT